jgi:hypothetical protein
MNPILIGHSKSLTGGAGVDGTILNVQSQISSHITRIKKKSHSLHHLPTLRHILEKLKKV